MTFRATQRLYTLLALCLLVLIAAQPVASFAQGAAGAARAGAAAGVRECDCKNIPPECGEATKQGLGERPESVCRPCWDACTPNKRPAYASTAHNPMATPKLAKLGFEVVPDKDDPTVPEGCLANKDYFKEGKFQVSDKGAYNIGCNTRFLGNDPCLKDGQSTGVQSVAFKGRVKCADKLIEKKTAEDWYAELGVAARACAMAAAANPKTAGFPSKTWLDEEMGCIPSPSVPGERAPYTNTMAPARENTAPEMKNYSAGQFVEKANNAVNPSGSGARQIASLLEGQEACAGKSDLECLQHYATALKDQFTDTAFASNDDQNPDTTPSASGESVGALSTLEGETYDPNDFRPGQEAKLARQKEIKGKSLKAVEDAKAALPDASALQKTNTADGKTGYREPEYVKKIDDIVKLAAAGGGGGCGGQAAQQIAKMLFDQFTFLTSGGQFPSPKNSALSYQFDKNYPLKGDGSYNNAGTNKFYDIDREWQEAQKADGVYLNTPAYAVYNPNDYRPGQERKLANALKGQSFEKMMAARLGIHHAGDSMASIPSSVLNLPISQLPTNTQNLYGLIGRINPSVKNLGVTDDLLRFTAGGQYLQGDMGLNLTNFASPGGGGLAPFMGGGGSGSGGFKNIIQQVMQGCGGGGGEDKPSTCTAEAFGDPDTCIASLAKAGKDVDLKKFSFDGCPRKVLDCMAFNTPAEFSRCLQKLTDEICKPKDSGGGGGSGGGSGGGGSGGKANIADQLKGIFGKMGSFGGGGGGNPMQSLMNAMKPKDLADFKKGTSAKQFNAEHGYPERATFNMFPSNIHYSDVLTQKQSLATKTEKPYNLWVPLNNHKRFSVRCAGDKDKNILPVDVIEPRYDEFNCHMMQRITYNRWCKGDGRVHGCCIKCSCPPKPCPCGVPCWSSKCWKVGIDDDNPPCAIKHNMKHDIGYTTKRACPQCIPACDEARGGCWGVCTNNSCDCQKFTGMSYCYHPKVKAALYHWAGGEKDEKKSFDWRCPEKHFKTVCHQLSKCLPMINSCPQRDVRDLDRRGLVDYENASFLKAFGPKRPYPCNDANGKEYGQTGRMPNYNSKEGAYVTCDTRMPELRRLDGTPLTPSSPDDIIDSRLNNDTIPYIDYGFKDGLIGTSKKLLSALGFRPANAQGAAGGARGAGASDACNFGGVGEAKGGSLGSGASPSLSDTERNLSICYNHIWNSLNCRPNVGTGIESKQNLFSQAAGVQVSLKVPVNQIQGRAQTNVPQAEGDFVARQVILPASNPGSGMLGVQNGTFRTVGGCKAPQWKNGLDELAKMGTQAGGAVITLKSTNPDDFLPMYYMVLRGGEDENGGYVDAVTTNIGPFRESCGLSPDAGQWHYHRLYVNQVPDDIKQLQQKAGYTRDDICQGTNNIDACRPNPQFVRWFHAGEEKNNCSSDSVSADSGGRGFASNQKQKRAQP